MEQTKNLFRDPFYEAPLHKGYYHPSQKKKLTKKDKKICLSPEKQLSKRKEPKPLKPADEVFLKGTNVYTDKAPPTGDTPSPATSASSKFNESWPGSERASTIGLVPEFNLSPIDTEKRLHSTKIDLGPISSDSDIPSRGVARRSSGLKEGTMNKISEEGETTLQKYINRFRYGQPLSREDRETRSRQPTKDFWWMNSRSPKTPGRSSTPKSTPSPGKIKTKSPRSPVSPYSPMKPGRSSSSSSGRSGYRPTIPALDEMTQKLQDRADRLLEMSESSLSSEPIVSTIGLGSEQSTSSTRSRSSTSVIEERPYRPGFVRYMQEKENIAHGATLPSRDPTNYRRDIPPDDILTQWRLRRKLENARDPGYHGIRLLDAGRGPGSPKKVDRDPEIESKLSEFRTRLAQAAAGQHSSPLKPSAGVHFTPSPTRQESQVASSPIWEQPEHDILRQPPIASPTLQRKSGTKEEVEPHLHLMCDILPCPHQTEHRKLFEECTVKLEKGRGVDDRDANGEHFTESADSGQIRNKVKGNERKVDGNILDTVNVFGEVKSVGGNKNKEGFVHNADPQDIDASFEDDVPVRDSGPKDSKMVDNKIDKNVESRKDKTKEKKDFTKGGIKERQKQKARKFPCPKFTQASPKPPDAVENVIGEVISNRLFISPTSSVESFDERIREVEASSEQDTLTSDCEEFADDELLRQLRKQRNKFEAKLKFIDQLLDQSNTKD